MVPVMITAPYVIWAQIKSLGGFFAWIGRSLFGRRRRAAVTAVTAEGVAVEMPEGIDSAKQYMTTDGTGLVETERDGVTIVSRQAAE